MKIAVITPYYKEKLDILFKCHQSVMQQTLAADHFMISDGFLNQELDSWKINHVKLPNAHGDNGNTPRGIGSLLAMKAGYDFIAYLDADNWFHPNHIESMISLYAKTKANILCSFRTFHTLDGQEMMINESQEDNLKHVDTSCCMIHKTAFELNYVWLKMNKSLGPICDRIFYSAIRNSRYSVEFTKKRTVAFRSQYAAHYRTAQIKIPENAKTNEDLKTSYDFLRSVNGIDDCVRNLGFWPLPYLLKGGENNL
jgi:glycosyltransferase involved in cell wall biosynthesis